MECQRKATFVVLTLLQLCRAEYIIPQWYSAKVNDGFQPQPISEIFTNEPVFSTSKPIIVSQKIGNRISDEFDLLSSTMPPSSSQQSTRLIQQSYTPTTSIPAGVLYQQVNMDKLKPLQVDILPQQQSFLQPTLPTYVPPVQFIPHNVQRPDIKPQLQFVSEVPPETTRILNVQTQRGPETTFTQGLPLTTLFQPQTQTTQIQPSSSSSPLPITVTNAPPTSASFRPPNSNYFLIYQQAPQSIQSYPTSLPPSGPAISEVTIRESSPTTVLSTLPPRTSEAFSTTRGLPISSISTTTPLPTTWLSTTPLPISTLSSSSVTVTPSSTLGLSTGGCNKSSTPLPGLLTNGLNKKASGLALPLKIRVIAPTGSITHVNINPLTTTKRPVTTRKPVPKTTTRKPKTRRTSMPKKNNYDRCLDGCRKVKDLICAAPLSHHSIDPKTLRGFPSVCHMACHNSYRKDPFEKVMEGSCSKLRTRIRLIDSKNKLKKNELRQNEYTVDQGQKTIIELSGLP